MAIRGDAGWDLAVSNRGQLVLVVQIKRKTNASPQWAAELRHNILAQTAFPGVPYFLIVFPDRFYLWLKSDQSNQSEPAYSVDAAPALQPYFARAGVTADQISAASFALIVSSWLGEIIHAERIETTAQPWLIESGLYAAIAGGKLEYEAAA
ncbi:MAG: hypothetical protein ACKO7W_09240 [Elainella sp.]